jgi:hypothetical protein
MTEIVYPNNFQFEKLIMSAVTDLNVLALAAIVRIQDTIRLIEKDLA